MNKILIISAAIAGLLALSACKSDRYDNCYKPTNHSPAMHCQGQYKGHQYGHHRGYYRW